MKHTVMKTNKPKRPNLWRIFSRRSASGRSPWLDLNLEFFNFEGAWRSCAREQAPNSADEQSAT